MLKVFFTSILLTLILVGCSKDNKALIESDPTDEEMTLEVYAEAVEALKKGDAYFAKRKFKEAEALMPQSKWAAKASLMAAYADYSRNSYNSSVFGLERHIKNYPADKIPLHFKKENAGVIKALLRECDSNFTELSDELEKIASDVFYN